MNNKKKVILIVVLAIILVVGVTLGYSFAYFTSSMINTTTPTNTAITTGSMAIEFTDGPEITLESAIPGSYVEKTFSVKNVGTLDTMYDIYMSDLVNNFADKTDLVYTLTSSNGANVNETQVPAEPTKIVSNQAIAANATQNYTLRIEFKETNDNQDDNKGKRFSTIIRINEVHDAPAPKATDIIKFIVADEPEDNPNIIDITTEDETCTNTFAYDGTTDNNLRYVGANPCNYVTFNNELWRIIGVMNNVETFSGQKQSLLKIIRSERLGNYSWDSSVGGINAGMGVNEWSQADLMHELNNDYLGNITIGTDGNWYSSSYNEKANAMPGTTISSAAESMIENVKWNLGSPNNDDGTIINYATDTFTTSYIYTGKTCTSTPVYGIDHCNDTVERTGTWTGKVALMYPSDYGYATTGGITTNRQSCLTNGIYNWYSSEVSDCRNNDWLYNSNYNQWTLSPIASSSGAAGVFYVSNSGNVSNGSANSSNGVSPVVFLKSNISITGGSGTPGNPYILNM